MKKRIQLNDWEFQLTHTNLRRDCPITVYIPPEVRNKWYEFVIANRMQDMNYMFDVDESIWCQIMSAKHLSKLMEWWDKNNEKQEIDLSS